MDESSSDEAELSADFGFSRVEYRRVDGTSSSCEVVNDGRMRLLLLVTRLPMLSLGG